MFSTIKRNAISGNTITVLVYTLIFLVHKKVSEHENNERKVEWYSPWGSLIKRQRSDTSSDKEWNNKWQRMTTSGTTSDNEWYNEWQRVATSGTTSDNEWYNEWQRMATSDTEWSFRLIFHFCKLREEPNTEHPKENSLKLEEDLEEGLLN